MAGMSDKPTLETRDRAPWPAVFSCSVGIWLAAVLVKLGNPIIFPIAPPGNGWEFLLDSWPVAWGYVFLAAILPLAVLVQPRKSTAPKWIIALPLFWLCWQLASALQTVDPGLTQPTLAHFAACLICFYLGLFALGPIRELSPFWLGLLCGLALICYFGLDQHFGGLERTRRAFEASDRLQFPSELRDRIDTPEFRKKLASDRIFSTFVYPNALAGAILLLLPPGLRVLWQFGQRLPPTIRVLPVTALAMGGLGCLFWSGSKAGWLIMVGMGVITFVSSPIKQRTKGVVVLLVLAVGLAGFTLKYSEYLARGAPSALARFDYWRAALQLMKENPILGSGPGTFKVGYKRLKTPASEMAKLAHNDYLQQGSDSGLVGFGAYTAFVFGSVWILYRRNRGKVGSIAFAVWTGILGLALQSLVEFGLYIPALAWPFFLLLGWLWGQDHGPNSIRHTPQA